ncbi:M14 family metallopeptidase [Lutibacter sp. A80]|uniref:M14 family metallopeptidase n=1 Tax=Lutibacter sp. A80 TaxID=2918453 RepID=UPI001F068F4C|nr:M14 family metallopeptidase [Lutibacter sp. A80]UMB60771.1 M14 family metallopeptidase [Lutibacter sp. A80]
MKNFRLSLLISTFFTLISFAQTIQSPSEFLGYELGTQFTRHHKIIDYFNYVSSNSVNVSLEKYGETNEHRPLYVSFISSEENSKNLEAIRKSNLQRTGILKGEPQSEIGIVWLSYNVHGNEASASEAAMLTLYKLITEKQGWLKNTVVIIDPCLNPDGRDRYVNWYNQTKSTPYNTNPDVSEHKEPWPSGRPNHYLFDLNRDWAWATQIESQQRLKIYNKWMPQVHVDFHEQFINNPYYFAPAAEPFHEIITTWQRDFQTEIGKNHAKHFDKEGWRYFTKESFDLLYPSYGDTYPTYVGAIGMTYEQAGHGMAGLGIVTENNTILTLKDRIAHHTTTGLSTVEVAVKNTSKMLVEFSKFFDNSKLAYKNYILRGAPEKIKGVINLLQKHEIDFYISKGKNVKAYNYNSKSTESLTTGKNDLIIPTNQPKGKMVKVLFEQETQLSTPITYDITAWSLPYAYGLQGFATKNNITFDSELVEVNKQDYTNKIAKNAYAYLHKWNEVSDAELLGDLLEKGFNVRFSYKDFSVEGNEFKKGTLLIMRGENKHIANFDASIVEIANRLNKKLSTSNTGFVTSGADFGSSNIQLITSKKIAVLAGEGTSSLSFGEIWHFFETQLKYPLNILNTANLNRIDLTKYQTLILPNGYRANEQTLKKLSSYATNGGKIIALGSSVNNFADTEGFGLKRQENEDADSKQKLNLIPFDQRENEYIKNAITGSIFKSTVDTSHPLAYGYDTNYYSLKQSSTSYQLLESGYNVAYFPENFEHVSGYAGPNALKNIPNSLLFGTESKGRGTIIYMIDNPLFRAFWENGKLFFVNAVFLN